MMKRRRTSKPSRHIAEINERTEASKSEARVCVGQPRAVLLRLKKSEQFYSSRLFL